MGRIFVVIGKSASGKDTIFSSLKEMKDLHLKTVVGYTTRPIRSGEVQGREYHFVSEADFKEFLSQDKVIEYRCYHTIHGIWTYFTLNDGQIQLETSDYLFINTLEAYNQIKKYYGEDKVIPIYIEVEDGERLFRALERERRQQSPKYAELCRRFLADSKDFSDETIKSSNITKKFVNQDINVCLNEIVQYIKNL